MTATGIPHQLNGLRRPAAPRAGRDPVEGLYALRIRELVRSAFRQPVSFWLVCIYLVLEYVRPQAIYTWMDVLPWARIVLIATPIAILIEGKSLVPRSIITWALGLFSIAVTVSIVWGLDPSVGWEKYPIYLTWVLAYLIIASTAITEARFFLFLLLFLLASFKMGQHGVQSFVAGGFGFSSWGATGAPGWFHNSGEFGIQMCIFFPMSLYFVGALRDRWGKGKLMLLAAFPASAVISIVASSSRGALVGLAAVGLWALLRSRHRFRGLVGLSLLAAAVWFILPAEQKDRLAAMGDDGTSQNRLTYWEDGLQTMQRFPITGIGYEGWPGYYRALRGQRGGLLHNIFLQAGAELGYFGLGALILMVGTTFVVTARIRRRARQIGPRARFHELAARGLDGAMIGFLVSGSFVTVLYYPYLWFALGMTAALERTVRDMPVGADGVPGGVPVPAAMGRWRPGVRGGARAAASRVIVPAAPTAGRRAGWRPGVTRTGSPVQVVHGPGTGGDSPVSGNGTK